MEQNLQFSWQMETLQWTNNSYFNILSFFWSLGILWLCNWFSQLVKMWNLSKVEKIQMCTLFQYTVLKKICTSLQSLVISGGGIIDYFSFSPPFFFNLSFLWFFHSRIRNLYLPLTFIHFAHTPKPLPSATTNLFSICRRLFMLHLFILVLFGFYL